MKITDARVFHLRAPLEEPYQTTFGTMTHRQTVIIILEGDDGLTGVGERYLNPTFGAPLRNLLFENINQETSTRVEDEVRRGLVEYFPRVIPTQLEVQASPDTNTVTLALRYAISDTNIEDDLVINFES